MANIAVAEALVLVDTLLRYLNDHQRSERGDVERGDVEQIKSRLNLMNAYLEGMDGNEDHTRVMKVHYKKLFQDLANEVEDVVDKYMFRAHHKFHKHKITEKFDGLVQFARFGNPSSSFREINSMITVLKKKINEETQFVYQLNSISNNMTGINNVFEEGESSGFSRPPHLPDDDEIVGFEEPRKKLMDELINIDELRWSRRDETVSVVGPGGCGKTCLVKNVFESERIRSLFGYRAWVQVSSQPFHREEVLRSILQQFCASKEEPIIPSQDIDVQAKLRNYLQEKKYLLVLDDIWKKEHWECIQSALPTDSIGIGSRIIVTTRNSDVASTCVHRLDGLSFPKAWELFCKKAFQTRHGKGKCPQELEDYSERIVKKCEGQPLAIVAIGSLLSKKRQQVPSEWQKVHDSLGSDSNLSIIRKVLLRSYKDLPLNLKRCFLYFSIFPEDYAIERGRLVRLWIAEGFVLEERGKTLEDVAEDYLDELIGRNLVNVIKWDFDGTARYCRVLNLVHEFIIQKSAEVNFVSVLAEAGSSTSSSSSSSLKARRLSIHEDCKTLPRNKDWNYVRSAFLFKRKDVSPSLITDVLEAFRFSKVLDLRNAPLDKFPKSIVSLVLLKYLCLRNTNIKEVPKSIGKLSYLETLDLKQTNVTELPKEIEPLENLRHLLVCCHNYKNYEAWDSVRGVELFEGIKFLTSLQKLSFVRPANKNHKIVKELGALTQLRKLGLVKLEKKGGRDLCTAIQKMEKLSILDVSSKSKEESLELDDMHNPPPHLQRLHLKGHLKTFPGWISKLDNLFRISLRWSKLESSPLEALQGLPHLIELQMDDAFVGEVLEFAAGGFKKLKTLQIKQLDKLHTVEVHETLKSMPEGPMPMHVVAMPVLEKLTLCNCPNLKILPLGIDKLTCLKELLLYDMPREFISRLQRNSEDWEMVRHIHVIHSYVGGSLYQNLSPAM